MWARLGKLAAQARPAAKFAALLAAVVGLWQGGKEVADLAWQRLASAPTFALAHRRCHGAVRVSEEDIAAMAQAPLGSSLLALDLDATARALGQHPWIKHVQVRRILPDSLAIDVEEHQPALWVSLDSLTLADEEGHLFKTLSPKDVAMGGLDLPILTGVDKHKARDEPAGVAPIIRAALAVAASAEQEAHALGRLEEIHWDPLLGWSITTTPQDEPPVTTHLGDNTGGALANAAACVQLLLTRAQHAAIIWADGRQHPHRVLVKLARRGPAPSAREASWQTSPSSSPASTSARQKSAPSSAR